MHDVNTIAKALISVSKTDGVDQAVSMLQALAAERKSTSIYSAVLKELDQLQSSTAESNQVSLSAHQTTNDNQRSKSLEIFGANSQSEHTKNSDPAVGGLIIESNSKRLDLTVDKQVSNLKSHLSR